MLKQSFKNLELYLLGSILLLLWYFNFTTPLWGNMLLAFGSFNQAEYHYNFPEVIFYADYIRGWFYKLIMFIIYKLVGLFSAKNQYFEFQLYAKIIYYLVCFSFTYISILIGLPNYTIKEKLRLQFIFWCIILLGGYRQFMESEELAAIIVIAHLMCLLSPKKWANALSGLFIFILFGCKAVTIAYVAFAPLYWLTFAFDKQKFRALFISHTVFLLATVALYATFLYPEWLNITTAMKYQDSAKFNGLESLQKFKNGYVRYLYYQPVLALIPLGLTYALVFQRKQFLFLLPAIIIASLSVIAQNRFSSPYHYLSFIPILLLIVVQMTKNRIWIIEIVLLVPLYFTVKQNLSANISYPKSSNLLYKNYFKEQSNSFIVINELINQHSGYLNDTMLFLSGDCPPYFFTRPNSNKMVGAILLNRGMYRQKLKTSESYLYLMKDIENYNGNYILYDPAYLPIDSFPSINKKLAEFDTLFVANYTIKELGEDHLILFKRKSNE